MKLAAMGIAIVMMGSAAAQGAVLMLDFGPTGRVSGTTDFSLNSPYHTVNPSFTGSTWNTIGTADVLSGLVYADGSDATGVAVNLGGVGTADGIIDLAESVTSAAMGTIKTGVYEVKDGVASVGTDGILYGGQNTQSRVGAQITGLAAGTYEVYVTSRNTGLQTSDDFKARVWAGAGVAGANIEVDQTSFLEIDFTGKAANSAWVEWGSDSGDPNYFKFTVTLTEGQALNVAATSTGNKGGRGFLNSIQVVSVPEPATMTGTMLGAALLLGGRRRRTIA